MKKLVIALMIGLLVCWNSVAVFGEEFSLRNGILFGDTIENVISKETLSVAEQTNSQITTIEGRVAGVENSTVCYSFNEKGQLYDELIDFGVHIGKTEQADSVYSSVYKTLCDKYGEPISVDSGDFYPITGSAVDELVHNISFLSGLGIEPAPQGISEWVVRAEPYNVKIDLIQYGPNGKISSDVMVSYRAFTNEEEQALLENIDNAKNTLQEEMNNDL